jgi:hypothetical protein
MDASIWNVGCFGVSSPTDFKKNLLLAQRVFLCLVENHLPIGFPLYLSSINKLAIF